MASLSCEPYSSSSSTTQQQQQPPPSSSSSNSNSNPDSCCSSSLVVSLFEVPFSPDNVAAFIAREHEFRFLAVQPYDLAGKQAAGLAVSFFLPVCLVHAIVRLLPAMTLSR